MEPHALREPFSALSHAAGFALAVPGTVLLWRLGGRTDRRYALPFGIGLVVCYAASTQYHAAGGSPARIDFLRRLDHVGIHLLIAGTYTPLAGMLLSGPWRQWSLRFFWLAALSGSAVQLLHGVLPPWLSTSLYMTLGWGAYFAYREMRQRHPDRDFRPVVHGGLLYSAGALINVAGWPNLWPGTLGSHELLHLFVLAGSLTHYRFVLGLVAPSFPQPAWMPRPGLRFQARHILLAAPFPGRRAALQPFARIDPGREPAG